MYLLINSVEYEDSLKAWNICFINVALLYDLMTVQKFAIVKLGCIYLKYVKKLGIVQWKQNRRHKYVN